AVKSRNMNIARLLLRLGADVNSTDEHFETALHFAAEKDYPDMIKLLLEANADINSKSEGGNSPLYYALGLSPFHQSFKFNQEAAKLLLEAGATVEQQHWDAMPQWFRDENARYNPTLQHSTLGL
ncbi:ankyrin, partial [Hyaloscypha hepaticicola]